MLYMTPPPATTTGHSAMSGLSSLDATVQRQHSSIGEVPVAPAPLVGA